MNTRERLEQLLRETELAHPFSTAWDGDAFTLSCSCGWAHIGSATDDLISDLMAIHGRGVTIHGRGVTCDALVEAGVLFRDQLGQVGCGWCGTSGRRMNMTCGFCGGTGRAFRVEGSL